MHRLDKQLDDKIAVRQPPQELLSNAYTGSARPAAVEHARNCNVAISQLQRRDLATATSRSRNCNVAISQLQRRDLATATSRSRNCNVAISQLQRRDLATATFVFVLCELTQTAG